MATEIGVRQLKAELSEVLRRVEAGEEVRVTHWGRPVADLVPVGVPRPDRRLGQLIAAGKLTPASRSRPRRPAEPVDTGRSATEIVLAERAEER